MILLSGGELYFFEFSMIFRRAIDSLIVLLISELFKFMCISCNSFSDGIFIDGKLSEICFPKLFSLLSSSGKLLICLGMFFSRRIL